MTRKKSGAFVRPRSGSRGAVLFVAVGAIAVLSILTLGATSAVLQEVKLAQFVTDASASFYPALSAVEAIRLALLNDETPANVTLFDLRPRTLGLGAREVLVNIADEEGKVFIDTAPKEILMRLPGLSDNEQVAEALSAAHIATREDIVGVEGMTEELYAAFRDFVTVYGAGAVNLNTAALEVMEAEGMDADLSQKIRAFRAGEDAEEGTQDDGVFLQPSDIVPRLEPFGLNAQQAALLGTLVSSGRLVATSHVLTFRVAVQRGKKKAMAYEIVLHLDSGSIAFYSED